MRASTSIEVSGVGSARHKVPLIPRKSQLGALESRMFSEGAAMKSPGDRKRRRQPGRASHRPEFLGWNWRSFYRNVCIGADLRGPYILGYLAVEADKFQRIEKSEKRLRDLGAERLKTLFGTSHYLAPALDEIPLIGEVQQPHFLAFTDHVSRLQSGQQARGVAPAASLLGRKRPDYFVPVHAALSRDFGVPYDSLSLTLYWSQIIRFILDSPWWNASPPRRDETGLSVWRCRTYFLSALYIED